MCKLLKFSFAFIAVVMLFSACNKDDNNEPANPSTSTPSGELTVNIGNATYNAISVTARETSNGSFIIKAISDDNRVLEFTMASFIGNAIYPLEPAGGNEATYSYTLGQAALTFSTNLGSGSLTITNYDSNKQTFDGAFSFEAPQVGGTSILLFDQGKLENVPILTLGDAWPGKGKVFVNGVYRDIDSAYAQLNNNFSIEVFLFPEGYVAPIRIIGLNYKNGTASTITYGIPYDPSSTQMEYFRVYKETGEVGMNGNMESVSGYIAKHDFDFELNYRDIPIVKYPMEVQPGELILKYYGKTVVFTNAESYWDDSDAPTSITAHFQATNTTGDSLHFSYYYLGEYVPNYWPIGTDETGVRGSLYHYHHGVFISSRMGYYSSNVSDNVKSFGFDPASSSPDDMRMRGIAVP